MAKLSVVNTSAEISAKQREKLFERFYRIDDVRNSKENHYGLGLAIAKAIVTAHKIPADIYAGLESVYEVLRQFTEVYLRYV